MEIKRVFSANFVFFCCFTWAAGKLINPEATLLNCTQDSVSGFCSDCLHQAVCSKDDTKTEVPCPTDQVCQEISGFSTCVDSLDVAQCDCPVSGVKVKADLYDDVKFIVCIDGTPHIENCAEGKTVNVETGECEAAPTTTSSEPTVTPIETCPAGEYGKAAVSCTQYRLCLSSGTTTAPLDCNLGEIFDTVTNECIFYSPFSCANKDNGFYTDTTNCSIYHLCLDGSTYGYEMTCSNSTYYYFDENKQECAPSSETECNILKDCGICPDATTLIQIDDCTSYYQCSVNEDESTKDELPYVPVYRECPSKTCFNQDSGYCEF